ncbi:hypothetical protein L3X38_041402 [Prunus dulcis]|uniref:Integrase catalytic domain-containing protein n=1 Tax=Prunus dulcis TaxID=3755 RepID=A0AAD4UU90_PRUDU|nr:hypothetical protein L3X38_041402 [Prunus dulcis]
MKEPKHPASIVKNCTMASVGLKESQNAKDVKMNNSWYVDSGCSNHMTGDERLLVDIQRNVNSKVLSSHNGASYSIGAESKCDTQLANLAQETGHLNDQSIRLLENQDMVHGLPSLEKDLEVCEGCKLGKQHRNSFPAESTWRAQFPLELKFKAMTELQSGYKVKCLRSDRGGEFMSNEFHEYCSEVGIQRQLTVAYSPQQNGVAERKNRTVIEMAKSMLHEKSIPYEFWAEAINSAVYLLNRCPSKSLKKVTPFEAYTGRKPGIAHLKVFGSLSCAYPSALRHKLEENSHKCIFVGYGLCEKGYRLCDPRTRKIILSRDVYFDEDASWKWENTSNAELRMPMQIENQGNEEHEQMVFDEPTQLLDTQMQVEEDIIPQDEEILDRSQVFDHTPHKWRSINEIMAKCNMCIVEPESFEEADLDES